MNALAIKSTLTGIGQTGIDLVKCAQFETTEVEKIVWGMLLGGSTATIAVILGSEGIPLGIGAGILGGATLGSTILGVYGARQKAPWTGAIGGALAGITATGCSILAAPILGGNPVGLVSSAALLGLGGTGGALLAIATGLAAKSGESSTEVVSGILMGAGGGFLLGAGIAGGLFCGLPTI